MTVLSLYACDRIYVQNFMLFIVNEVIEVHNCKLVNRLLKKNDNSMSILKKIISEPNGCMALPLDLDLC